MEAEVLVPIFICVILPIAIVRIIYAANINSDNKRAKILMKAIESNCSLDADKLAEALQKPRKTAREILNLRLLRGCIFSLIGVCFCIVAIAAAVPGSSLFYDPSYLPMALIIGIPAISIGISYLVVYFVTRKQVKD